jgi:hypothetical protein
MAPKGEAVAPLDVMLQRSCQRRPLTISLGSKQIPNG